MSNPFPQIRLHGDKDAAKQHVRRGMAELFRTEAVQERMGVPIFKRTVEVDSQTKIEVHISKEQKFINIISTPLEHGEEVVPVEEKEFDISQCPPGFIVRKQGYDERFLTGSLNQTKYKDDGSFDGYPGHIIAYDGKQWRAARYDEANLGAFEGATSCGWWHLGDAVKKKQVADNYKACDVITWEGGHGGLTLTTAENSGAASTGQEDIQKVPGRHFLKPHFYHGGKKIQGPGNILCACILKTGGKDYYYAVHINTTNVMTSSGSGVAYPVVSSSGRVFVSRALVSNPDSWSAQYSYDPQDPADNDSPNVRVGYVPVASSWHIPWGTGYIDKEGNAYVMQFYFSEQTIDWGIGGYTALKQDDLFRLVKIDLRSGKATTVADQADGTIYSGYSEFPVETFGGPNTFNAPPAEPTAKTYGYTSGYRQFYHMNKPCFIGMWGGGQDLYTYWIEPFAFSSDASGNYLSVPNQQYQHPYVDQGGTPRISYNYTKTTTVQRSEFSNGEMILTCYKMTNGNLRGTLHDQITIWKQDVNISLTHTYEDAQHDYKRSISTGGWEGPYSHYYMAAHVFSHHPEIKNSWEYATRENTVDGVSRTGKKEIAYYRDGKKLLSDEVNFAQGPLHTTSDPYSANGQVFGQVIGPGWFYQKVLDKEIYYSPGTFATDIWWQYTVLDGVCEGLASTTPVGISPYSGTYDGYRLSAANVTEGGRSYGWTRGYFKLADFNYSGADHQPQPGWGHRIFAEFNQPGSWPKYHGGGSGTQMTIAQHSINIASDNRTLYRPSQAAVHRPVQGLKDKPYIRMRRKMHYHSSPMSSYDISLAASGEYPNYAGAFSACHGWDEIWDTYESTGPQGEDGKAVSSAMQYNYWFSNYLSYAAWRWWVRAPGNAEDGYEWDEWEIDCNFATKDQINAMVGYDPEIDKGAENMFFEIAVI